MQYKKLQQMLLRWLCVCVRVRVHVLVGPVNPKLSLHLENTTPSFGSMMELVAFVIPPRHRRQRASRPLSCQTAYAQAKIALPVQWVCTGGSSVPFCPARVLLARRDSRSDERGRRISFFS